MFGGIISTIASFVSRDVGETTRQRRKTRRRGEKLLVQNIPHFPPLFKPILVTNRKLDLTMTGVLADCVLSPTALH